MIRCLARRAEGLDVVDELLDEVVLDVMVDLSEAFPAAVAALADDEEAELHDVIRGTGCAVVMRNACAP